MQGVELGEPGVDAAERRVKPPLLGLARRAAGVVGGERGDSVGEGEAHRLEFAREASPPQIARQPRSVA